MVSAARTAPPGSAPQTATFPHTERYEDNSTIYTYGIPTEEEDSHFYKLIREVLVANPGLE